MLEFQDMDRRTFINKLTGTVAALEILCTPRVNEVAAANYDWYAADSSMYNKLPYYVIEEQIEHTVNSKAVLAALISKTKWSPNEGNTLC